MGYSFQKSLIEEGYSSLLRHKKVVLAAAPGSGKTNMAISIIKRFQKQHKNPTILILAHGQCFLRNQWSEFLDKKKVEHLVLVGTEYAEDIINTQNGVFLALPQSLRKIRMPSVDLLITDESHHYYLSPMSVQIRKLGKPKHELLLTGTPSLFLQKEEFHITGITIQELMKHKVIHDPQIEIVNSAYTYNYKDYTRSTHELTKGTLKKLETDTTLDNLLKEITLRLASRKRASLGWCKASADWPEVSRKLHKTMIVCSDIAHAWDVQNYFKRKGVRSLISVCKDEEGVGFGANDGTKEIEAFKTNKDFNILVVVKRGVLGFNFEWLTNIIDLSGSWNVNRIFQLLCRLIRKNPDNNRRKKLFLKVTNDAMFPLTYFVMSYVVAMSHEKYYYSFLDRTARAILRVPVHEGFNILMNQLKTGTIPREDWPLIPRLLTFKDIEATNKKVKTVSYTSFNEVINLITEKQEQWNSERVIKILRGCKTKKELRENYPTAYGYILRTKKVWLLNEFYGPEKRWNLESALKMASNYPKRTAFRKQQGGAYNWLKKTNQLDKLDAVFEPTLISNSGGSIKLILKDPGWKVYPDGNVYRQVDPGWGKKKHWIKAGNSTRKSSDKRIVIHYRRKKVAVNRIVYTKYIGPLGPTEAIMHKDGNKRNCNINNLKKTTVLKACRSANKVWNPTRNAGRKYKLTQKIAEQIRADNASGIPYNELTKKYGISKSNVSSVVTGKTWKV